MRTAKARAEKTPSKERKSTPKSARLAARLSPEQKMILARAAELNHQPVSQFVISSAIHAAEEAIRQHQVLTLSARDSIAVMEALLNPQPAGEQLQRVAREYKEFMAQQ